MFVAGYMSFIVLSKMMSEGRNPELGKAMETVSLVILVVLILGQIVAEFLQRRAVARHAKSGTEGDLLTLEAQESLTIGHDAETVWGLIRPAENAVLLGNARRAFTVPGTPNGVGEQLCFIGSDGSVSISEVVGEEVPRFSTARLISPSEADITHSYELEPTPEGCSLQIGIVLEVRTTGEFVRDYEKAWREHTRQYLTRVARVLALQQREQQS